MIKKLRNKATKELMSVNKPEKNPTENIATIETMKATIKLKAATISSIKRPNVMTMSLIIVYPFKVLLKFY